MSVWTLADLAGLAKRRRPEPDAMLATPARPGPSRRQLPRPEQIAGNVGERTNTTRTAGHFTSRGNPQSFPMP